MRRILFAYFINFSLTHSSNVSQIKCQEYSQFVYENQYSPILFRNAKPIIVSNCEIVAMPLIVGGTAAKAKEFPHMAVIGFGISPEVNLSWLCGGSLISELYVLTAAHCLRNREYGYAQKVRLGLINLDEIAFGNQEKVIIERIAHPDFHPPKKNNDIALLRLDSAVEFTGYVRPACLNILQDIRSETAEATGFGQTSHADRIINKQLLKVTLQIYSNDFCKKIFNNIKRNKLPEGVVNSMLCVGQLSGGKDTCQGDSGGPLQIVLEYPYCMYSIIGITSFGNPCGFRNSPAIYTKVADFVPWIEKVVWGN